MRGRNNDTDPEIGYHEIAPSNNSPDERTLTDKNTEATPGRGKSAITKVRIARIETVTMTATEYTDAVEALAVLIARYERTHPEHRNAA